MDGNCAIIYNLTFCDETAYAVPSNPIKFKDNSTGLAQLYDGYAQQAFTIFQNVLAQIPCEVPSTQRYSLVRKCGDCEAAYKTWLCSVTIPRCEDFSVADSRLQPRAAAYPFPNGTKLPQDLIDQYASLAFNSSRNLAIDTDIQPGPYREVLPCDDLCYNLVQSCPSAMGFSCPMPDTPGFNTSYGQRTAADSNGSVTCNYPGSAHFFSSAGRNPLPLATLAGMFGLLASLAL